METPSLAPGADPGSRDLSVEEQQYEEDLKRALEESVKTHAEDNQRRKFLGYDVSEDASPVRDHLGSTPVGDTPAAQNPDPIPKGDLRSPPDLMSFKFEHVMNKYRAGDSDARSRVQGQPQGASVLSGRSTSSFHHPNPGQPPMAYPQLSMTQSYAPKVVPAPSHLGTSPGKGGLSSPGNRTSWGEALFQPLVAPGTPSPATPNQKDSAIWTPEASTPAGSAAMGSFLGTPVGTLLNPPVPKEPLGQKLSAPEMLDSLWQSSMDSLSKASSFSKARSSLREPKKTTAAMSSSFPRSDSGATFGNPFASNQLSFTPQTAAYTPDANNSSVVDGGNIRRISSQPDFRNHAASKGSTVMLTPSAEWATPGALKQSRSSERIQEGSSSGPSGGNNLMCFSPTGPHPDEVFDFSYFDPLRAQEEQRRRSQDSGSKGGGDPLPKTESEPELPPGDDGETPPPIPPRRPKSLVLGNEGKVKSRSTPLRRSAHHGGVSPTKSWVPNTLSKSADPNKVFFGDGLYDINSLTNEEGVSFGRRVARIRKEYDCSDTETNPGHVISPVFSKTVEEFETSVKIVLYNPNSVDDKPVMFTCDVNTSVQHIIIQALCYAAEGNVDCDPGRYALKIPGKEEYLLNDMVLGHVEYVQEKRKLDEDVRLVLVTHEEVSVRLARTIEDDEREIDITTFTSLIDVPVTTTVSRQGLDVLIDNFTSETDKVMVSIRANHEVIIGPLIQSVKVICTTLAKVETNGITQAIHRLESNITEAAMESLTKAVVNLIDSYCNAFDTDFNRLTKEGSRPAKSCAKDITSRGKNFAVRLDSAHRLPREWKAIYESFTVQLQLFYSGQAVKHLPEESWPTKITTAFFDKLTFAHVVEMSIPISQLPRESRLCFTLLGQEANSPEKVTLGWVVVPLFNYQSVLISGTHLLGLWPNGNPNPIGTCASNLLSTDSVILQVDFLKFRDELLFPSIQPMNAFAMREFSDLDQKDQSRLRKMLVKGSISRLPQDDANFLWAKRHYCHTFKWALPQILSSAPTWDWASLPEIYSLLFSWPPLAPLQALQLLHPRFADQEIRYQAVTWMKPLTDDELCNFLPQLVQALKYESYHNSALVSFLLRRSLSSIRIAHFLYWYLQDTLQDEQFKQRALLILGALLAICGNALRSELQQQKALMDQLSLVADRIKGVKDVGRLPLLHKGLTDLPSGLTKRVRLPTSPSVEVNGLKIQACTYFQSFTVPLKLTFNNSDLLGDDISVMYKVGEDMRQDMLTMQMIRIMDKLWLSEGLDLRMLVFRCMPTGPGRGLVELVPNSETLRKIQVEHGVTGSFKDKPLALWLQKHNPSELEYEKAVENFTYSCAGYCVATYVLGVGDRHNDNIMITKTGHTFHVDFGKFLGNLQMFGNIKRDRTPFVLSSDMAYVINGGDKPTSRFQEFVDLCCEGFNLVRKHADIFLNLFGLMLNTGISQLSKTEDLKYVQDALKPEATDAEATTMFTRFIEASLGSKATQINFFFHNLAQRNFSASSSTELSFAPKRYSLQSDGKIKSASIFGIQKRYEEEKYYVYIIRIVREGQSDDLPSFIFRRFSEFEELHQKLGILFPHIKLPPLIGHKAVGRTHIRQVAEKRKKELEGYLRTLLKTNEVSTCDLVYTFFHPSLRDEKDSGKDQPDIKVKAEERKTNQVDQGQIGGQVKLSIYYQDALFISVSHAKDLPTRGGLPDPYVKTYLIPDPYKTTKKKTKVIRKTNNPTYNEIIMYRVSREEASRRTVRLTVWNSDILKDQPYMGGVDIILEQFDLSVKTTRWFTLGELPTYC